MAKGQENENTFTFNQISEAEFRKAMEKNFNAIPVSIGDSARPENAPLKIEVTDLSKDEIPKSIEIKGSLLIAKS